MRYTIVLALLSSLLLLGCEQEAYVPKPKGYHRIELPEHTYMAFPDTGEYALFPYQFEISRHSEPRPDTSFMTEPYWMELYYPTMDASVDISYKPLLNMDSLVGYTNTSNKLTFKHNVRATAIEEYRTSTLQGDIAVLFELEGDVPSQFQFYVTDSADHFLRAALYFPTSTKNDSLAPVIEFIKKDMVRMVQTVEWRDK